MSKISALLIGIVLSVILIPSIYAQTEYQAGTIYGPITIFSDPKDPKIVCDEFADICVGLWWESNILFRGVKMGVSYDRFQTTPTEQYTLSAIDYSSYFTGYLDYYDLAYDVTYDDNTGEFRMFAFTDYDTLYRWKYESGVGLTALSTYSTTCFSFINGTHMGCTRLRSYLDGGFYDLAQDMGIVSWSSGGFTQTHTTDRVTGGGANWNCRRIHKAKGFMTGDDSGNIFFTVRIEAEYAGASNCAFSSTTSWTYTDLGSFSGSYDGIFYWDRSYLFYRFLNVSDPATSGVYRISTSDFSTFGSPILYYNFNDTVAESINYSDFSRTTYEVWVYEKVNNASTSGLYSYESSIIPITYINRVEFPQGEVIPPQQQHSATVQIGCPLLNYTDSDSGTDGLVYTKCLDPTISITSAPYIIPTVFNGVLNASGQGCTSMIAESLHTLKVNFTLTVLDSFSGDPVSGASVIFGTQFGTTDANGEAVFYINPVDSASMTVTSYGCYFALKWNGTARNFPLTVSHANYSLYTDIFTVMKTSPSTGENYFDLDATASLDPFAINALVEIESSDGYELTPSSALIRVTAPIDAYYISPTLGRTVTPITSHKGDFPQQWQFFGNGTYSITFNLTYGGNYYSQTINATTPSTQTVTFTVAEEFENQYCEEADDCTASSCVAGTNTFLSLAGCFNNSCSYTEIECAECDPVAGCYDIPTGTTCSSNIDCLPLSTCITSSSTNIGLCSSEGLCVLKTEVCEDFCETFTMDNNVTVDTCEELYLCSLLGRVYESFAIYVLREDIPVGFPWESFAESPDDWRIAHSTRFGCGLENVGTSTCIAGTTVNPVDIGTVENSPLSVSSTIDWDYEVEADGDLRYYDLLVTCDQACEIEYEFCPYGCAEGICLQTPGGGQTQARNLINSVEGWWRSMFPDPYSQAFAWTILTLILSFSLAGGIAWLQRGGGGAIGGQEVGSIFIATAIGLFMLGAFIGTMPLFISIVFTILSGFLLWRLWA